MVLLSISAAARRVKRDRRTIHRWMRAGMASIPLRDPDGRVVANYVEEEELLRFLRLALMQDPARIRGTRTPPC